MEKPTESLETVLLNTAVQARAAEKIASALAGLNFAASSISMVNAGVVPVSGASSVSVPVSGASSVGVSTEAVNAFMSGVLPRLGFAPSDVQLDVIAMLAERVSLALRGMDVIAVLTERVSLALRDIRELDGDPALASALAADIAGAIGSRLLASPDFGGTFNPQVSEIAAINTPAAQLKRHRSIDD